MSDTQIINHVLAFLTSQFGEFCHVTVDDAVNTIAAVDSAAADELDRLREEVERLRAERDDWKECCGSLKKIKDAKEAELKEALELAVDRLKSLDSYVNKDITEYILKLLASTAPKTEA